MTNTAKLQAIVLTEVEKRFQQAEKFFNSKFLRPKIEFTLTGMAAGRASFKENYINFNFVIYETNQEEFLERTVPHEVAHLVAYYMFGIAAWGHGRYWKSVMLTVFNVDPTRTHSYDISAVKTKKYEMFTYKCQCRTHKMTKIRHNRVMRNTQRYFCNYCKTLLVFQG